MYICIYIYIYICMYTYLILYALEYILYPLLPTFPFAVARLGPSSCCHSVKARSRALTDALTFCLHLDFFRVGASHTGGMCTSLCRRHVHLLVHVLDLASLNCQLAVQVCKVQPACLYIYMCQSTKKRFTSLLLCRWLLLFLRRCWRLFFLRCTDVIAGGGPP